MDDAQDITPASDSKRKRSKVSRACDECRRKKVSIQERWRGRYTPGLTKRDRFDVMLKMTMGTSRHVRTALD